MVERQLRRRGIVDERVLAAMGELPREAFLPPEVRADAYRDGAVPIGEGQTMSQPWIVACMSSLLALDGGERVLEVGTGSGYGAAVLGKLAAEVVTIERHEPLAQRARETLGALGLGNVEVRAGDGTLGAPDRAPFDGIVVTAVAEGAPPQPLVEQLAPGAPLVCPVRRYDGEHLMVFRNGGEQRVVPVRFVPLVSGDDE
jgi:protein-L-isoaspartate(D-aspartate) O-methyltransferase